MTAILLCLVALIVLLAALYFVVCRDDLVARVWCTVFPQHAWYPPEAAEAPEDAENVWSQLRRAAAQPVDWNELDVADPVDEHFNTSTRDSVYVKSNHPTDCAKACCWEIRLTEMHDAFDWGSYEYEMRNVK